MDRILQYLSSYFDWFFIPKITVFDVIDVVVVTLIVYELLIWIKNTRAWTLLKGIVFILGIMIVAYAFKLNTILFITRNVFSIGIIAIVILFQPELRRALDELGRNRFTDSIGNFFAKLFGVGRKEVTIGLSDKSIYEIVKASLDMSRAKTGALIVIENDTPLGEYESTGISIDAAISAQLLTNIFEKNTPLHDGAVIVRDNRIVSATCYLPLTDRNDLTKELGTRHRAGIGISEVSDSVTIIVSEETGSISVAKKGNILRNLSENGLREQLLDLQIKPVEKHRKKSRKGGLKI
ncbi:MAG: diadenylate cyclase CdaA [Eubacterium sp.]|nr:diadenylate cyclase CdaA [Eubacterium sp.]